MKIPCQGCAKEIDLETEGHKLYIAVRRPTFREVEIDACSPECASKVGMKTLASLLPTPDKNEAANANA